MKCSIKKVSENRLPSPRLRGEGSGVRGFRISSKATILLVFVIAGAASGASTPVPESEQARWVRRLLPLPKQVSIEKKVELPAAEVKLTVAKAAGGPVETAADELRSLFKEKAGAQCGGDRFEIIMGVCDAQGNLGGTAVPDAAQLADLPNADQAYVIRPLGDTRLVLAALDERGVYYAGQTLRQLLENSFHDGKVTIPLATVTDWPDLAERGLWGGSANRDVVWMSQHKMNLVESHVDLGVTDDGRGRAAADQELINLSRRHALKLVPVITHLNGLGRRGVYEVCHELRGQGDHAVHPSHKELVAPCCSQPKMIELLADWISALAEQEGVTDVCAWLSELSNQYCDCAECRKAGVGQYALEARALVKAHRLALKKHPDLGLRILLTQGSYSSNDKVLAEIPADVGVTYYDGGRTYDSSRDPMIYPLLEQYTAGGRWLGCYPQLTASWRIVCPWSGPQFVKFRMQEFVAKKLKCLCGYATPDNRLYEFNVLAAAEWSWNSGGRDEREFAAAWATRRGIQDPDAAAEWAVTLGPVGWDVYGSRVPFSNFFGRATAMVAGRRKPKLGDGMFRYFPSVEHMDDDLAACQKAMAIAERLDEPALVAETQVIQGYVQMVKAIWSIAESVSTSKSPTYDQRLALQKTLGSLSVSGIETVKALETWERLCGKGSDVRIGGSRLLDTVDVTEQTVAGIARSLEELGIRNPIGAYLREEIGKWVTEDFDEEARISKTFDVTRYLAAPGVYQVGFKYTSGWNGLSIFRVALASAPAHTPENLTELSVDEHQGSAAVRNRANVYTVTLEDHNPDQRYYILADVRGTPRHGRPPERQGCNGSVWIKGQMPDAWRTMIEQTVPLTDAELTRRH